MQSKHRALLECTLAVLLVGVVFCFCMGIAQTAVDDQPADQIDNPAVSIPWGAMYTPNEHPTNKGMTGTVKYYRGRRGADSLIDDLRFAQAQGVRLILTPGSVTPGDIYMDIVHRELDLFFEMADAEVAAVWVMGKHCPFTL